MTAANFSPLVESFFHEATCTFTHVVFDRDDGEAAIVDPVLDYDAAAARTSTAAADAVCDFVRSRNLRVTWILETHVHADHLSAGAYLRDALNAKLGIGRDILGVQTHFKKLFGLGDEFAADGSQFDRLFEDGDALAIGALQCRVMATPGHTADSLTYLVGDAAFIGDTLFAPETGTARADFPGGDAARLYDSIHKILALPACTRLFLCHDYPPNTRTPMAQSSIAGQREHNPHVRDAITESEYVALRRARDATLAVPRLLLPAVQVNIRGGRLPPADADGVRRLTIPLNRLGAA
ncbi:MAG: MBL fold metallo-hydrolase [Xanthomonadaceae bacterium]|nr:MBL fold metallo-hydrolase [Xanthomonadaceae bacterium]MDE2257694.1 MBL fold metallo-hydrolase [Xanthomonadaceae bacterium]